MSFALQPLLKLEVPERKTRYQQHQGDSPQVAVLPVELGHKLKVHTVHACHQRSWHEDHGSHREDFYYLVLLDVDKTECSILDIVQTLEAEVGVADK